MESVRGVNSSSPAMGRAAGRRPGRGAARFALVRAALVLSGLAAAFAAPVRAEPWPSKPIRMIVPFAPGGGNDYIGRLMAKHLSARLGQQVYVENRGGANGMIGLQALIQSEPDGYTIATTSDGPLVVNPHIYGKSPYDPLKDFTHVALMVKYPVLLVTHPAVPIRSVAELVALAKAKPGSIAYSSGGVGNYNHLAGELLANATGTKLLHVPYKGTGPATMALVAGEVQVMFSNVQTVIEHVRAKQSVALGVGELTRMPELPDVPAVAETVPGFESYTWVGIVGPPKMPKEIVDRLSREITDIMTDKDLVAQLAAQYVVPMPLPADAFTVYVKKEFDKWGALTKAANIRADGS
jgi:tripartite-type tricarboxylate transporter receptor subunit TctC